MVADALTRFPTCNAAITGNSLKQIHNILCHPGVRRMAHYVRTKNLPYLMEKIKSMTSQCRECALVKPRFCQPPNVNLIKATQPFERISVYLKGPLPSNTRNRYMLTIVHEYTRFNFAFPTMSIDSKTVIECQHWLFSMFGAPAYVHSNRGQSFFSRRTRILTL